MALSFVFWKLWEEINSFAIYYHIDASFRESYLMSSLENRSLRYRAAQKRFVGELTEKKAYLRLLQVSLKQRLLLLYAELKKMERTIT